MVDTSCEILSNQQNRIRVKNYRIDNNKKKEIVYVEGLEGFKYKNEDEGIKKNRYKTNYDSSKGPEYDNKQTWAFRLRKTKKDKQKEVLTNYQRSDKTIFVSEIELEKVKKFQGTAACSRREVKKPARGTFDEIYKVGYIVEENKDKR
ncbi:25103_t:CDS:2, partial [Gigaspora rosea]